MKLITSNLKRNYFRKQTYNDNNLNGNYKIYNDPLEKRKKYDLNLVNDRIKLKYINNDIFNGNIGENYNKGFNNEGNRTNREKKKITIINDRYVPKSSSQKNFTRNLTIFSSQINFNTINKLSIETKNSFSYLSNSQKDVCKDNNEHLNVLNNKNTTKDLAKSMTFIYSPDVKEEDVNDREIKYVFPISKRLILLRNIKSKINNALYPKSKDNSGKCTNDNENIIIVKDETDELNQMVNDIFFPIKKTFDNSTLRNPSPILSPKLIKPSKKPILKVPSYSSVII